MEGSSNSVLGRVATKDSSKTSLIGRDQSSKSLLGRDQSSRSLLRLPPSKLQIVFIIFLSIVVILQISSLATPWWLYSGYRFEECETDIKYSWHTVSVTCNDHKKCTYLGSLDFCDAQIEAVNNKNWRTLADCGNSVNNLECQTLPSIFDSILAMNILSLLSTIVLLVILILKERTSILPDVLTIKKFHLAISGLACILSLIAIIVYGSAIPATYHNANRCPSDEETVGCDFTGEIEINLPPFPKMTLVWGPGPGWVLGLVNLALMVGFLFLYALRG